jgi:hypothetical protein
MFCINSFTLGYPCQDIFQTGSYHCAELFRDQNPGQGHYSSMAASCWVGNDTHLTACHQGLREAHDGRGWRPTSLCEARFQSCLEPCIKRSWLPGHVDFPTS